MAKKSKNPRLPRPSLEWLRIRWWQKLIMLFFWPLMMLGTLYVAAFFFINSDPFARIVEAQLDAAMMGEWEVGDIAIGPSLSELTIESAVARTPEGDRVVLAEDIEVPVRLSTIVTILKEPRLEIADVTIGYADVLLDFRGDGDFNLIRAVASPAPSDEESKFTMKIENTNIRDADVVLRFDGFDIEANEVSVTQHTLELRPELYMHVAPESFTGPRVRAGRGRVRFKADMLGFPMGGFGDPETGVVFDGGSGVGGHVGRMSTLGGRALHNTCVAMAGGRRDTPCGNVDPIPTRGQMVVDLARATVSGFWWDDHRFGFERFETDFVAGEDRERVGHAALISKAPGEGSPTSKTANAWMDVNPPAATIAEAALIYGHAVAETLPIDTILYHAPAELQLDLGAPLVKWWFGQLLREDSSLELETRISGDLNNAEGPTSVRIARAALDGLTLDDVQIDARLEGSRVDLHEVKAKALGGTIRASGEYKILDSDFEALVNLGEIDENLERSSGIDLGELLPSEQSRYYAGELTGVLTASKSGHRMEVKLEEPLELELSDALPYSGATSITIEQMGAGQEGCPPLVALENRHVETFDEIRLQVGRDRLVVAPEVRYGLDSAEISNLDLQLDVGDVRPYTDAMGLEARSDRLTLRAKVDGPLDRPTVDAQIGIRRGRAQGIDIDSLNLDASLRGSRVTIANLDAETSLGSVEGAGWVDVFGSSLSDVRSQMPLAVEVSARGVELSNLPWLKDLDLAGEVEVTNASVTGTTADPKIAAQVTARDLRGFGESLPWLETRVRYTGDEIAVQGLIAHYGSTGFVDGKRRRAELAVGSARYGLRRGTFAFEDLSVSRLRVHELAVMQDSLPDLRATVDLSGSGSGDIDAFLGSTNVDAMTAINGTLDVTDIDYGGRAVGELSLAFKTPETSVVEATGEIRAAGSTEPFPLSARADLNKEVGALELSFPRSSVLELAPEVAIALNGDATAHRGHWETNPPLVAKLDTAGSIRADWSRRGGLSAGVTLDGLVTEVKGERIDSIGPIQIGYHNDSGKLDIHRMELAHNQRSIMVHGGVDLDGLVDIEVTGEVDAALARLAGDTVAEAKGSLALALSAQGDVFEGGETNLDGLDVGGFIAVRQPIELRIRGLGDNLVVDRGVLYIARPEDCPRSGEHCFLIPGHRPFGGRVLGGKFELSGEIGRRDVIVPTGAELLATAEDVSYRLKDALTVTVDVPELRLFVLDLTDLELLPPQLYGTVEITEGRYYQDHLVQSEIFQEQLGALSRTDRRDERFETPFWQRFPELAAVQLDITVNSESGFRIDNAVAGAAVDIELELNNFRVGGTLRDLEPSGVVNIRDGTVAFRQTRFEVLSGAQLRFRGDLDAVIDVSAQAEVNTQNAFASTITGGTTRERRRISTSDLARGSQLYIVTLSLTGPLSRLEWSLESSPFLTSNNIYTLIVTGKTLEDLGAERDNSPAFDIAFGSLLAPFFEAQVDELLSADQFKFQFAEGAAQFSYIQQVNNALRIAAGVSIRGSEGNESAIASEYRFDDRLLLELIGQNTIEEEGKAPQFSLGGRIEWRILLD